MDNKVECQLVYISCVVIQDNLVLSTQLIKPNYLVILPPTQHHSFFRNLPPFCVVIPCSSDYYANRCREIYDLIASRKYSKREGNQHMKEWAEHCRQARQRTVRRKATKDKAGALPPAVYQRAKTGTWSELSFPNSCAKSSTTSVSNESVLLSTTSDCTVVTFVSDDKTPQVLIATDP